MSETEWREGIDPVPMLAFVRGTASDRKLRLLACACCRRIWDSLPAGPCRRAVEVAEALADGRAGRRTPPSWKWLRRRPGGATPTCGRTKKAAARASVGAAAGWELRAASHAADASADRAGETAVQCAILRDMFAPFRIAGSNDAWRTATAVGLAELMYASRDFSLMWRLSTALMEAGCDETDSLDHCREVGPHVRGCWVIDLILGRK